MYLCVYYGLYNYTGDPPHWKWEWGKCQSLGRWQKVGHWIPEYSQENPWICFEWASTKTRYHDDFMQVCVCTSRPPHTYTHSLMSYITLHSEQIPILSVSRMHKQAQMCSVSLSATCQSSCWFVLHNINIKRCSHTDTHIWIFMKNIHSLSRALKVRFAKMNILTPLEHPI